MGVSYVRPNEVPQSIHKDHQSMISHALLNSIPALQDVLHDY